MHDVYIRFFHGRHSPSEVLGDWGFDGPIIGPVELSFTYEVWNLMTEKFSTTIEFEKGCACIGDAYYGDISVLRYAYDLVASGGKLMSLEELIQEQGAVEMSNKPSTQFRPLLKPGRFLILRLRSNDGIWVSRLTNEITQSTKESMECDHHVAYDFSLPEGEDLISSTLGLRELADMNTSEEGRWPKLVEQHRRRYKEYTTQKQS